MTGNLFEGDADATSDNSQAIQFDRWTKGNYRLTSWEKIKAEQPFGTADDLPTTESASQAYEAVLAHAGASLRRDSADRRLVEGVRARTHRMIDSQREVGGWPVLKGEVPAADSDRDGMPDAWEKLRNLDPESAQDGCEDRDGDGYTNLEEYLNSLVLAGQ